MSLGIALGGFAEGFESGMRMGQAARDQRKANRREAAVEGIQQQGEAAFTKAKAEGTTTDSDYESFMADYMGPKMTLTYLKEGDVKKADEWQKFTDSSTEKRGGKLIAGALVKANMGDIGGALEDAAKAAKIKGFLPDGYSFDGYREIRGENGQLKGYYFDTTTPDGKGEPIAVPLDGVPEALAGVFAPVTRFEAQYAAKLKAAEGAAETKKTLFEYEEKKKIDVLYPDADKSKDYEKMYHDVKKSLLDNDYKDPETGKKFSKMTEAEQKEVIYKSLIGGEEYANIRKGAGLPEPAQVVPEAAPDQVAPAAPGGEATAAPAVSGVQKGPDLPPPSDAASEGQPAIPQGPAVSGVTAPQAAAAEPGVDPTTTQAVQKAGVPVQAARPAPTQASPTDKLVAQAELSVKQGVNPVKIATQLMQGGIQPAYFPPALAAALREAPVTGIY